MQIIASFAALFAAILSVQAVTLSTSGVYTFTAGSQAIVHASPSATTITAPQFVAGAGNQAWTVVVNSTASTATLQNTVTRSYMVPTVVSGQGAIVPSPSPFSWLIVPSNGKNKFCVAAGVCVASSPDSSVLTLAIANHGVEEFDANPTVPPSGVYQIQNIASGGVVGAGFVPTKAFLVGFPAGDRSEVWQVLPVGDNSIALENFDTSGFLSVRPQEGNVVGTWDRSQFLWTMVFESGVGQVLQGAGGVGAMTASAGGVTVTSFTNTTVAWVFYPEDPEKFLP